MHLVNFLVFTAFPFQKVRFGLYIFTISVLLDVMIIFVPVLCFSHSMEAIQLWTCAANVGLAMCDVF